MKKYKLNTEEIDGFKIKGTLEHKPEAFILDGHGTKSENIMGKVKVKTIQDEIFLKPEFITSTSNKFIELLEKGVLEFQPAIKVIEKDGNEITKCELISVSIGFARPKNKS